MTWRLTKHFGTLSLSPSSLLQQSSSGLDAPACRYRLLVALYWRINGASHLYATMKSKDDNLREKVRDFIDAHVHLAMRVDAMSDPSDAQLLGQSWAQVPSRGRTEWLDDRDAVTCTTRILALEETPFEVLGMEGSIRNLLGKLAAQIRAQPLDETLEAQFVGDAEAFDHYYPLPLASAEEVRAHSWYLSVLLVINQSWEKVRNASDSPEAHAHYRIMGAFVPLLYAVTGTNAPHSDEAWRPRPDGRPNLFELHAPEPTTCFHAGDLPGLDCLFDQVGLFGVQSVKGKVPLVQLLIKVMSCAHSFFGDGRGEHLNDGVVNDPPSPHAGPAHLLPVPRLARKLYQRVPRR
jgi:hypothetical protein